MFNRATIIWLTVILSIRPPASAQSIVIWDGGDTGSGTAWHITNNWAGNSNYAGSTSVTTNSDTALFSSAGTNTTVGISFVSLGSSTLYAGTISLDPGSISRTFGSTGGTSGTLVLNGSGTNNLILSNDSTNPLTINSRITGTGGLSLRLTAENSTIHAASGDITISATINESQSGRSITKTGSHTLTLDNINTHSGVTTIAAGTIKLTASGSVTNSQTIMVGVDQTSNSAQFDVSAYATGFRLATGQTLGGTGTVLGSVDLQSNSVIAAGGTINPGVLTITGGVENAATNSARFDFRINGGTVGDGSSLNGYDQLAVSGAVELNNATLNLSVGNGYIPSGQGFLIINNTGTSANDTLTGNFSGLGNGSTFMAGGYTFRIYYGASADGIAGASGGNDVVIVPVPEPAGLLAAAAPFLLLARYLQRCYGHRRNTIATTVA